MSRGAYHSLLISDIRADFYAQDTEKLDFNGFLALDTSYNNAFYDGVLSKLRSIITTDRAYSLFRLNIRIMDHLAYVYGGNLLKRCFSSE